MRTSKYLLSTLKENPTNTEIISHKLMLRAGMIRQVSSGIYTWLPTGIRVLRKIENIIREEMNSLGALEICMPFMQPSYLWKESKRWSEYGSELLHLNDRYNRELVLGPTYEEMVTSIIGNEIISYKQLPLIVYQIQTKFRDEMRPCFGVIRSREFIMKDAYSFHINKNSLELTYNYLYNTYKNILKLFCLDFHVIKADSGPIGGDISHEFQILTKNIENDIIINNYFSTIINEKFKRISFFYNKNVKPREKIRLVNIPNVSNIFDLLKRYKSLKRKIVKTFIVRTCKNIYCPYLILIIRGDNELDINKVVKLSKVAFPIDYVNIDEIYLFLNNFFDKIQLMNMPLIVIDKEVSTMKDFIIQSAIKGKFFFGVNWGRDFKLPEIANLCKLPHDNIINNNKNLLVKKKGIEVGHIFQLGEKYSNIIRFNVQNKNKYKLPIIMGCYGIGISRIIPAIIEQNHDKYGILWPNFIAPFEVAILPINMYKCSIVKKNSEKIYQELKKNNIEVILDDRKERPGVMFSDLDLIGIPHILIINNFYLNTNEIEYKNRRNNKKQLIKISNLVEFLNKNIIKYK